MGCTMYSTTVFNYLMTATFQHKFLINKDIHICISSVYLKVTLTPFSTETNLSRRLKGDDYRYRIHQNVYKYCINTAAPKALDKKRHGMSSKYWNVSQQNT